MPKLFFFFLSAGNVAEAEMHRVFNCGIGMILVVDKNDAEQAISQLNASGEKSSTIGKIVARPENAPQTIVV